MTVKTSTGSGGFSRTYTGYAVGLLALVNLTNYMDRMVLSVLLPSIKADLNLTDGQLGWLTGMAFAIFYGVAGIPIARIADLWVRKHVISLSLLAWSAMTMLSGAANSFATMLLVRIGVGAGEAGCIPTGHSMISDMTPKEKRAGTLAIFTAGSTLGMMLGLALGGWLSEQIGWRWTFVVFGAPGILLAVLVTLTLREPPRGHFDGGVVDHGQSTWQVVMGLIARPAFLHLLIAFGLMTFVIFGFAQWLPSYYLRTFDVSTTTIGVLTGFGLGAGMTVGTLLGGAAANRLMPKDMRWGLWIAIIGCLVSVPLFLLLLSADDYRVAFIFHTLQASILGAATGPTLAILQSLARPGERATASAINGLTASLIGLGGGPLIVGYLSDFFAAGGSTNSLRSALMVAAFLAIWPAVHFLMCGRTLREEIARVS